MERKSVEDTLREIDIEIIKIGAEYGEILKTTPSLKSLDERVRFLRVLFRRRDRILEQYASEGGCVKNLYTFNVGVGDHGEGQDGIRAGAE